MRVLVAGATGAVGRQLVPCLEAAGHEVVGISRRGPRPVDVLDAAREAGVGRILAQSIPWAYASGDAPADESVPLDPTEELPRARVVAGVRALESAVAALPEAVVLRYGILYGSGTWYAPGGAVAAALAGDPGARFPGSTAADGSVGSFVHVGDAAEAAVRALEWPPGAYNVVDDEPAPGHAWLPVLAEALGGRAPGRAEGRAPWARGAANARARALGWAPARPSWRTGFADRGVRSPTGCSPSPRPRRRAAGPCACRRGRTCRAG
ncbi:MULTISPECIES: NAD(P)-dependent oxidoreductase [unclassified Streptomyces]|uniref:NAD-dependent epimerase/dehydratase family protein n=1 Tax=unclassified Streptomyces TaxID=2593676 RepID=UPI0033A24957